MNIQNYFLNEGNTEWDMDMGYSMMKILTHYPLMYYLSLSLVVVYFEFYHFLWSLFGLKVIASFFFFPENFLYSHDVGGSNNFQGISVDLGLS